MEEELEQQEVELSNDEILEILLCEAVECVDKSC